jgi:hypothetical protein
MLCGQAASVLLAREIVMLSRSRLTAVLGSALVSAFYGITITALALGELGHAAAAGAAETPSEPATKAARFSDAELEELVGPVALYPDELLAIVLPASTYPLQIVQGARFLEKRKTDPELEPDEEWDPSVLGLLNYPEVIDLMNDDLSWTWRLGEAVTHQQADVMDAVQRFRARVDKAGNLESNDKMTVVKETEGEQQIIIIESASPEVIYVPSYQPSTVVVYHAGPYPYYYSRPYSYYYSPAAAFWTGLFLGAAVGWGLSWGWGRRRGRIKVDRDVNVNVNKSARIDKSVRGSRPGGGEDWKPGPGSGTRPGERPGTGPGERPGTRPGERPGTRPGEGTRPGDRPTSRPGERPSTRPEDRPSTGPGERPGTRPETRPSQTARSSPGTSQRGSSASRPSGRDLTSPSSSSRGSKGSSLGSYGSGSKTRANSARGSSSRGSRAGGSGRSSRGGRGGGRR